MAIERIFLDWERPCLPQVADWIISRYAREGEIDLRHVRMVLPGGRAVRRLTELLVEKAEQQRQILIPPRIITSGALPEQLYESNKRPACSFERHMAWLQALESCNPEERRILLPNPPEAKNIHAWFMLAQRIDKLANEVAAAGLRFSDVAEHCLRTSEEFSDERWQLLAGLQSVFWESLDTHNLADLHEERILALEQSRCRYSGELVLVATSDLPLLTRTMLLQNEGRCVSLVHAPEKTLGSYFDELGCVAPKKWADFEITIEEDQLVFSRNPADQALAVISSVAALSGKIPAEEISIGCCSQDAKPYLLEALSERKLPLLDASGLALELTAPILFLKLAADYLQSGSFRNFATLLRHPDVQRAVLTSKHLKGFEKSGRGLLQALDEYQSEHLQDVLGMALPGATKSGKIPTLARAALEELLGELTGEPRNLAQWSTVIANTLVALFGVQPLNPQIRADALVISSCSALHEEISKLNSFSPAQEIKVSAAEAIRLLLSQISGSSVDIGGSEPAIEILGWLELQLDDASVTYITSLNEGYVPETINSDPFLPNSLRAALGLLDNERRFARDAYSLSAILHSRREAKLFATRLDAQGSPLRPSRLLFACSGEQIATRIKTFFEATRETLARETESEATIAALCPPKPVTQATPPAKMSVTGFRDYLECPYRYYLKHILKLRSLDDSALELDAAAAGTILHCVLTDFGSNQIKNDTSEKHIGDFLLDSLDARFTQLFGSSPLSTVRVQRLQAEARLKAFAAWQARWRSDGWELTHAEMEIEASKSFLELPNGGSMQIQGRIDRIDFHPQRREWFVFDYKTGDAGDGPLKTHQRQETWINLQLPLYYHLLRKAGFSEPIRLGFIVLPADLGKLKEQEAGWSESEIDSGLIIARKVAQSVHDQVFWPPKQLRRNEYDDYRLLLPEDFTELSASGAA